MAPEPRSPGRDAPGSRRVGVLALQGDFAAHAHALRCLGARVAEIRRPVQLRDIDGLVIPGGESTAFLVLMGDEFAPALREFHARGRPIYGTCAGLILLAREVLGPRQSSLGLIDVTVERNAYGRQRESFEADLDGDLEGGSARLHAVFIRAPRIRRVGPTVRVLASLGQEPVLVRSGPVVVSTFHPELTEHLAVHRYFLGMGATAALTGPSVG